MVTGIVEVTQDPEKAGSALKVLSLRLRGMKGQLEELGEETDENVENISKMQGQILNMTKGKVNIFDGAGNFKSTYEIMKGIAEVWDELSSVNQANLLETIAGKNRANDVAALLSNWENVEAAVKSASEAEGSAARENAKYVDSIQGRLDKMTTSWQSFANTFMSSDFLKGAISALTGFIEVLEEVIDVVGAFPTLMGTIATGMSFKNKGFFSVLNKDIAGAQKQLSLFGKSFKDIKRDFKSKQGWFNSLFSQSITKADVGYITDFMNQIESGIPRGKAWTNTMKNASVAGKKMAVGIKQGTVSMSALKTATNSGKAALFGLKVAATVLNTALTMGLSFAIQLIVEGIMKLVNADKELAESVDEITSKFKEQHDELQKLQGDYDTGKESSMVNRYAKLSNGVDSLGRNISLTADEYSEYQDIVNKIAKQFPKLVSGYDEQGNALLSCKGNVEELTTAYEKLIHAQNQEILSNSSDDIEKNWKNKISQANGYDFWEKQGNGFSIGEIFGSKNLKVWDMKTGTAKLLDDLLSAKSNEEINYIVNSITSDRYKRNEVVQALQNAGYDVNTYSDISNVLKVALANEPHKIKNILDNYYAQFDDAVAEYKTKATALLSEAFDISSNLSGLNYGNISEELQSIAYQTVNSLDFDFLNNLTKNGTTIEQWTTELLNQLNAISKADNTKIEAGFDLQTQFNGGEISYGEYVKNLKEVQSTISGLNLKGEAKEQLEISLGLDENGVITQYNTLVNRLTDPKNYDFNISESEAKKLLDGLSAEELAIAVDVIADMSNNNYSETAEEIKTAIERELSKRGLSLDLTVEKAKVNFEALSTAIAESFSGSGLSEESIGAVKGIFGSLKSYDSSKLFERTANGIRLNSEEYRKLNSEYKKTNLANINKEMDSLGDIYNQTREELYRLAYGTDEYNNKLTELNGIEQSIKDLEQLAAGVKGVTSAFQEWQMVESAGSQRDMYESIIEGFENIDDEIKRGWYDDGTIEFLELLTGKDLSTAGIEEVKKAYKGLGKEIEHTSYSVRDFFTVDEDGNSTNGGVYNFLDAVGQLEEEAFGGQDVVKRKNGKIIGFNFDLVGGDEVIAEALGVSEELVQIMVRAADDAGFVVTMDGTYEQLDILKEKAQEAAESLNRTLEGSGKKGFDFNFNTSNVEDIKKQLTEAQKILDTFRNTDGTINTKLEGADEALTVASTLQSMLDRLTRPTYMDIQVNQVEKELQEPLRNLQELRRLTETEHQLKLSGADTTELQEDINELYTELDKLPDETKIEIGLVDDKKQPLTGDALKNKINDIISGDAEVAIKATVDIQLEMDEKLGILVDKALLEAGIIDEKEFKKRVDIYLDAEVNNKDAKDKVDKATNEAVGNDSGTNSDGTNRNIGGNTFTKKVNLEVETEVKPIKTRDFLGGLGGGVLNTSETTNAKINVDTSEAQEKIDKTTEQIASLEIKAEELSGLIKDLDNKEITIDVKVKGLDDVKELNKNINLATEIDGSIDNLTEYVDDAKALSELDDNITSYVTAEIKGNVTDEFEYKINNLKVFTDSAKDLGSVGFIESEVTANVKGNVVDEFEYKIDNLKAFSDSAENVGKIGDVESVVKADIKGNVVDEFEYKINNLKVFSDSAKDIYKIGNVESNVKATINSGEDGDVIDEFEYKLNNLEKFAEYAKELQGLEDVNVSVDAAVNVGEDGDVVDTFEYKLNNLSEFAGHVKELQGLKNVDVSVSATVNTGEDGDVVDTFEHKLNNLEIFADGAKALQGIGNVSSEVTAKVNVGESGDAVDTFEYKLNNLNTFAEGAKALQGIGNVSSTVTAEINSGSDGDVIDEFEYKLDNLEEFAKYAKDLSGIGKVDVSVSAKVNVGEEDDVVETFEYKLNNLDEFSSYAKDLQGLGNVDISIKANVETGGDAAVDEWEYKLNNLDEFANYAKDLQGLKSVDITISANAKGNVVGEKTEGKINNLEVFAEGAKELQKLEDVDLSVKATVSGDVTETAEYKLDNLGVFKKHAKELQGLKDVDVSVNAEISGNVPEKTEGYLDDLQVFAKGAKALQGLKDVDITVNADIGGNVPDKTEGYLDDLQVFAKGARALQGLKDVDISVNADVSGNALTGDGVSGRLDRLTEFKSLVSGMSDKTVAVKVTANVDSDKINGAIDILKKVSDSGVFKNYNATVKVGAIIDKVDDAKVKNYKAPDKKSKVSYSVDENSPVYTWTAPPKDGVVNYSATVDALTDAQKHKTGTITYKAKISGFFPVANGTANANGSASGHAFARGDWGVKKTETALTGELGQELVVYGNRYWTVGDNGAEFTTIPKGAIVFNHKQTEELFKNGKVTSDGGRGRTFANGSAFVEGTAYSKGEGGAGGGAGSVGGNSAGSNSSKKSSSSSSEKDFKEVLDWIEVIIDRVERAIDKFDQQANNIYKSWSSRNTALLNEISKVEEEISLQQKAYNRYIQEANSIGLSSSWAEKVRNGKIDINTIKDENLAEKIKNYETWYNKALDCKDAIEELKETEASLYAQRVENVSTRYDGILGVIEHEKNILEEYISQSEAQAWLVSAKYYDALAKNERENLAQLKKEKADMISEFNAAMDSGKIAKGSEAYYDLVNSIDEVTLSIVESETKLKEWQQTIQQSSWEIFDILQDKISSVTDETEFLIDLLSGDKLYDDNGQLTNEGSATMGLHGVAYNTHMYQADQAAAEAARLKKELEKDPYDTELEERYREMISLQQEHILAAKDERDAIKSLVEEGIQLEIEALEERIDKYNEALDSQKDLYDYQKKIKEQTEEIASLEKQMAAYSGDNSEESRAKVQELRVSLEEAKTDLEETEYDKYISDTQQMLDDLTLQYSETLNMRLDNVDALISDMITQVNTDATSISNTISEKADSVGYTLSDSMSTIWDTNSTKINDVITNYGDKFANAQTTTNNALSTINTNLQNVITQLNSIAKTNIKSASVSSVDKSKNKDTGKKPTLDKKPTSSTPSGTIKVGGKINASGAQIYDYAGDKSGERQLYRNDPIYKVLKTNGNWVQVRWHKLSKGVTGWFKKGDVKAYATGKQNFLDDEIAWTQEKGKEFIVRPSDGAILTPVTKGDSILNAQASGNIWDMANSPAEFIKDNLNLGATNVPNNSNVQNNYTQNLDKVVFNFPSVKNYDEMLSAMQKDPNFERLLLSMTIDRLAGKSSLAKGKSIR